MRCAASRAHPQQAGIPRKRFKRQLSAARSLARRVSSRLRRDPAATPECQEGIVTWLFNAIRSWPQRVWRPTLLAAFAGTADARADPMRHATDTTDTDAINEDNAAWLVDVLRTIWEQQRDRVDGRICVIECAVDELAHGSLDADLRREAERSAHMLAGSIGMFGFVDAAQAARGVELSRRPPARRCTGVVRSRTEHPRGRMRAAGPPDPLPGAR